MGSGGISWPLNSVEWSASAPAAVSQRKGPTWSRCLGEKKNCPCLECICGSLVTVPIELLATCCRRIWNRRVQMMSSDRYPCAPQSLNTTPYETGSPRGICGVRNCIEIYYSLYFSFALIHHCHQCIHTGSS